MQPKIRTSALGGSICICFRGFNLHFHKKKTFINIDTMYLCILFFFNVEGWLTFYLIDPLLATQEKVISVNTESPDF